MFVLPFLKMRGDLPKQPYTNERALNTSGRINRIA